MVTMRHISEAVWVALITLFGVLEIVSFTSVVDDVRGVLRVLTATRARRVLMLIGWMWLGWHFFAR